MSTSISYQALVQELYIAYFGRPSDYYGLQNFEYALSNAQAPVDAVGLMAAYQTNASVTSTVDAFGKSTESTTLYGGGSTGDFVNAVFTDLFNRPAAAAGLAFWTNAIDSKQVTPGEAALAILAGALQNDTAQGLIDQQTIANKVTVAENFTLELGASSSQIVAYAGAEPAADARAMLATVGASTDAVGFNVQTTINDITGRGETYYSLTASTDTVTGGPVATNVFGATLDNSAGLAAGGQAQTLSSGDSVTGGPFNNVLALTDFGLNAAMTIPGGTTFSGITQVKINSLEGATLDFSAWQNLGSVEIDASKGQDSIVVGDHTQLAVSDSLGNVSVQGGSDITVTTDNAHSVGVNSSSTRFYVTLGDSTNSATDVTANATVYITAGAGSNVVTLGAGATGSISFATHTAADTVVVAPSGANPAAIIAISGLNNSGSDTIRFSGDTGTLTGFTQVTAAEVTASGGNSATLAGWLQAADGAQGSGVSGAAHTVTWFVFQGNTYLLESVAGQTHDAGVMADGNTLVELSGTGYTFGHASGAGGTLHLLG